MPGACRRLEVQVVQRVPVLRLQLSRRQLRVVRQLFDVRGVSLAPAVSTVRGGVRGE